MMNKVVGRREIMKEETKVVAMEVEKGWMTHTADGARNDLRKSFLHPGNFEVTKRKEGKIFFFIVTSQEFEVFSMTLPRVYQYRPVIKKVI